MARLAAEHFAGILVATAPDDPVTFDISVGNLKPVLMSWVGAAIAKIAEVDTFSAAWKNLIPTPDTYEEVLASAQAAHAAGALFKNVKGCQPPEFAPEPEEAGEAEVDDFDAGDDESQADDQGLLSADIDLEEVPMAAGWHSKAWTNMIMCVCCATPSKNSCSEHVQTDNCSTRKNMQVIACTRKNILTCSKPKNSLQNGWMLLKPQHTRCNRNQVATQYGRAPQPESLVDMKELHEGDVSDAPVGNALSNPHAECFAMSIVL